MVPAVTIGNRESELWNSSAGCLSLDRYPCAAPTHHAIVLHGPWDYAELLTPIALAFQAANVSVVVPELPGCGRNAREAAAGEAVTEYGTWVERVTQLCRDEQQSQTLPITLVGIGLGGVLAYFCAAQGAPVERLFVTALADPRRAFLRQRTLGIDLRARLAPLGLHWLSMLKSTRRWVPPLVAARQLCTDKEIQRRLEVDPLCAPEHPVRLLISFFATAPALEPESFTACPVTLVAPTADRWLTLESSLDFYAALPGEKQLHMLEGSGHLPIDRSSAELLASALVATG